MSQKTPIIMLIIISLIFFGLGFWTSFSCSASQIIPKSEFEKCIEKVNYGNSAWSIFGDINIPKSDSAAVANCLEIAKFEMRKKIVDEYFKNVSYKNKALFIMGKQQKRTIWEKD
jgi:hypothetical protein